MFHSEQTPLLPRLEEVSAFDEALTSGKVYVLLFGLSIHSLFEGLGNCFIFSAMIVDVWFHIRVCVRVHVLRVVLTQAIFLKINIGKRPIKHGTTQDFK